MLVFAFSSFKQMAFRVKVNFYYYELYSTITVNHIAGSEYYFALI